MFLCREEVNRIFLGLGLDVLSSRNLLVAASARIFLFFSVHICLYHTISALFIQ
jgi:hypothetical protein